MAVEEGSDDAAAKNIGKGLVMGLWTPISYDLISLHKASNTQSPRVDRSAAKAGVRWSVDLLQASGGHQICSNKGVLFFDIKRPVHWLCKLAAAGHFQG